jgi:hypothetical protein
VKKQYLATPDETIVVLLKIRTILMKRRDSTRYVHRQQAYNAAINVICSEIRNRALRKLPK